MSIKLRVPWCQLWWNSMKHICVYSINKTKHYKHVLYKQGRYSTNLIALYSINQLDTLWNNNSMNQTMGISIEYTTNYSINEHQLYETNSMKQTVLYETESMRLRFFFITCAMPWCSVPPRWWGVPSGLFLALKKVYLTTHGGREAKTQPRHRTAIGLVSGS